MRGLLAISKPGAAEARTQGRSPQGRSAAEDGEHGFLVSRGMAAPQAASACDQVGCAPHVAHLVRVRTGIAMYCLSIFV